MTKTSLYFDFFQFYNNHKLKNWLEWMNFYKNKTLITLLIIFLSFLETFFSLFISEFFLALRPNILEKRQILK